jgi:hypothetical protein
MAEIAFRWSGASLILGAVLVGAAIVTLSLKPVVNAALSPGVSLLLLLASVFLLLALPAVYTRQAGPAGWLGLAGHALLQTGMLLLVIVAAPPILYPSIKPALGEHWILFALGIALTLGLLLTGIATVRAGVFPRWAGLLLLAATAGIFFDFFVAEFLPPLPGQLGSALFGILLALALAGMGGALWLGRLGPAA